MLGDWELLYLLLMRNVLRQRDRSVRYNTKIRHAQLLFHECSKAVVAPSIISDRMTYFDASRKI